MDYNEALEVFNRIFKGELIVKEEENNLIEYVKKLLSKMKDNTISLDEQNLLDTYVNFLREQELTAERGEIIGFYDEIVSSFSNSNIQHEVRVRNDGIQKVKKLDTSGTIQILSILYFVLVSGVFIAVLAIALK